MEEKTITITQKEFDELSKDSAWLSCLNGAGVDNWEGYDFAIDSWYEHYQEHFGDL